MIRICSVHHKSDRFLGLQEKYFEKNTNEDYVLYIGYSEFNINDGSHKRININLTSSSIHHSDRLNYLFNSLKNDANDDDLLVFVDSDAFPISTNWVEYVKNKLKENPIVSVLRKENSAPLSDCLPEEHPHPCFFVTTVKFWRENSLYFDYKDNTGVNVLNFLRSNNLDFSKLVRSNTVNIHPLMFGVYDDIVYHHGAGNRPPYDGVDVCLRKRLGYGPELDLHYPQILIFNQKLSNLVYNEIINDDNFICNYLLGVK
jgi:hypothetical protein